MATPAGLIGSRSCRRAAESLQGLRSQPGSSQLYGIDQAGAEALLVSFKCSGCIAKEIPHYSKLICSRGFN